MAAKRNASGSGNIRRRSDGRWEGRYTVSVPFTEKRKRRCVKNCVKLQLIWMPAPIRNLAA